MAPPDSTNQPEDNDSLESDTVVENKPAPPTTASTPPASPAPTPTTSTNATTPTPTGTPPAPKPKVHHHLLGFLRGVNIYLLAFIFILIVAVVIVVIAATTSSSNNSTPKVSLTPKNLTSQQLAQIAAGNSSSGSTTIGTGSDVLNIDANSIFDGQVLLKQDLSVAGSLKLGSSLSTPNLTVPGSATFGQLNANSLTASGNGTVQGQLTVGQNLTVNGTTNFAGAVSINSLTVQSLQFSGDLLLNHHVTTNGPTPSRSSGSALGIGGTSSVSGTDTAGSLAINTGSSPSAGCFATINFTQKFASTPHVIVTPVGASAAGLSYYIDRTSSSLSICTASAPPAGSSFGFDYLVFD